MKRFFALILAVTMMLTLAACGNSAPAESASEDETQTSNSRNVQTEGNSHMLVAYFSLAGEQYGVGVIEEGNTSIIAHMIADQTGADLFEIEAVTPYPTSHSELLDVSRQEMANNTRPEITDTVDNMDDYDTIFIGYPNWWGDMPMSVYTFLEKHNWQGKAIIPFCTHEGSGLGSTASKLRSACQGATMLKGLAVYGHAAQNSRKETEKATHGWLTSLTY